MFKTHFRHNKDTVVSVSVTVMVFILILINIVVLVPLMMTTFAPLPNVNQKELIDRETVNQAIEDLTAPE